MERRIAEGAPARNATSLGNREKTVKKTMGHVFEKLGLESRTAAALRAVEILNSLALKREVLHELGRADLPVGLDARQRVPTGLVECGDLSPLLRGDLSPSPFSAHPSRSRALPAPSLAD